jgi:hypothetical protein
MIQGQCGGNALDCGKGSTTPCIAAAWPTAACKSSGWTCNRYGEQQSPLVARACHRFAAFSASRFASMNVTSSLDLARWAQLRSCNVSMHSAEIPGKQVLTNGHALVQMTGYTSASRPSQTAVTAIATMLLCRWAAGGSWRACRPASCRLLAALRWLTPGCPGR